METWMEPWIGSDVDFVGRKSQLNVWWKPADSTLVGSIFLRDEPKRLKARNPSIF